MPRLIRSMPDQPVYSQGNRMHMLAKPLGSVLNTDVNNVGFTALGSKTSTGTYHATTLGNSQNTDPYP